MLDLDKNTVDALNQVKTKVIYKFGNKVAKNILFIGNSITYHEEKADIGWLKNCGMAASSLDNDYVHQFVKMFESIYGKVNYAICNFSFWELNYFKPNILDGYESLLSLEWDLVIINLNENVKREALKEHDYYPSYKALGNFFKKSAKEIIFVDSFWPYVEIDPIVKKVSVELNEKFVHISDISFIEGAEALGMYEHPGVCLHPSDYGMKLISDRIFTEYQRKEK